MKQTANFALNPAKLLVSTVAMAATVMAFAQNAGAVENIEKEDL